MTAADLSDVTQIVGALDVACDWREPCDQPAEWIVRSSHSCEKHTSVGVLCDNHLRWILLTHSRWACNVTGEEWAPARRWLTHFERINKKPPAVA